MPPLPIWRTTVYPAIVSPGASGTARLLRPRRANARSRGGRLSPTGSPGGTCSGCGVVTVPSRRAWTGSVGRADLPSRPCACCTPPTGTSAGRCTAPICSPSRRRCWAGWPTVVAAESVDVVLVAGDVYDRAVPSADATGGARPGRRPGCAGPAPTVVLTPGQPRLRPPAGHLLRAAGRRRAARPRRDRRGSTSRSCSPTSTATSRSTGCRTSSRRWPATSWACRRARSHEAVLAEAMDRVRADLFLRPGARSVVLAHAFVGGGQPSESERDICVGGVDLVPAAVFDGVDYVALGHLHRPQTLIAAAALQRLAAGLLLRRGRPAEAGLAGRARRRRPGRRPRRCRCRRRAR